MTTTPLRTRRARGIHPKRADVQQTPRGKGRTLPEYLEAAEVRAPITAAPRARAKLLMLTRIASIKTLLFRSNCRNMSASPLPTEPGNGTLWWSRCRR